MVQIGGAMLATADEANNTPERPAKQFSHPERIRYDGDCFQIEGKDTFVYSAAFHYYRTPKELWRERLDKIKQAGFNTIETYVPWNWHERELPKGLDDYSQVDVRELEAFLKLVHEEYEMYSIVRPGPFICAEWAGGGYPRWLAKFIPDMSKEGMPKLWLRSDDQAHIDWSVHWYRAVCPLFAKHQLSRKKPGEKGIILVQIENEYNHHGTPGKEKVMRALFQAVVDSGVDVPIFTCLTNECRGSSDPVLSQVFDSDNYYIGHSKAGDCAYRMASLKKAQPDAPGLVCELQGGWFSTVGGGLSEDHYSDAKHYQAINIMSMLGGATCLNPYMFVGGTHFAGWGARGQTTSYDYNAAIRESGAVGDKYLAAKALGGFIREHEARLVRAHGGPCEIESAPKSLTGGVRVAPDGTRFVFVHNADSKQSVKGTFTLKPGAGTRPRGPVYNIDQHGNKVLIEVDKESAQATDIASFAVELSLAPMDSKILVIEPGKKAGQGSWYPKTQKDIARPQSLPKSVRIATALKQEDPSSGEWKPFVDGTSLSEMMVSDHRYVRYKSQVTLSADEVKALSQLNIRSFSRDMINARVNGKVAKRLSPDTKVADIAGRHLKTSFERIGAKEYDNQFSVEGLLQAGENTIELVYENIGHEHGYVPMEQLSGVDHAGLSASSDDIQNPLSLQVSLDLGGVQAGWTAPGFVAKGNGWQKVALDTEMEIPRKGRELQPKDQTQDGLLTWYRLEFELPAEDPKVWVPWLLRINASGNGYMWINGHNIGRHYQHGQQRDYFLPGCWLKFGQGQKNVMMLGLRQTSHGAQLKAAEICPYPDAAEVIED
ncbi:beta-galactosidase [Verrucomicrobiaceae bacterium N1E253]|uniref:Beta-galactosidase n=2 Tax=Oceaniferula marina TaxID=2748318 RepID=A0A851GBW6_9BACT|nr:beta-galactosidase [Oceaniferula marina]